MKKTLLLLAALLCLATGAVAQSQAELATYFEGNQSITLKSPPHRMLMLRGDVNCDATVNITDAIILINGLLQENALENGDVNRDGEVNISDAIMLINMIANGTNTSLAELEDALNSIYSSMRSLMPAVGYYHDGFGINAHILDAEVMGDDMMIGARGYGWFWTTAAYGVKINYDRATLSYYLWNAHYIWIANANYLLEALQSVNGTDNDINYIKGQAYAIRAYSYFMLSQWFARTYKGHQSEPCVPLFTGTTFTGTTGAPRATVTQVYNQIDADITQASSLLEGKAQQRPEHMCYAVVQGLRSRVALVKENWTIALTAATNAINASGKTILEVQDFDGLNDATKGNVLWGARIPSDEVGMNASFWAHMSPEKAYGQRSPKQISKWLYNKISSTDARRNWWKANTTGFGSDALVQDKFKIVEGTEWDGDYIWMRIEEMYLNAAEGACRSGQTTAARNYLRQLMAKRDPNYTCTKSGNQLGALTNDLTGSLLEEILLQRRIELWGEDGRVLTIRRLRQGIQRNIDDGWNAQLILSDKALDNPESYNYVLTIPFNEFNGNPNMNREFIPLGDQNPMGDVTGTGQNLSFKTATSSKTTARTSFEYTVTLKRQSTEGEYITFVRLNDGADEALILTETVTFPNGVDTATVTINCQGLTLGQTYRGTLSLSSYDEACHTGGSHISSHTFTINCQNGNPAGQKISFQDASLVRSVSTTYLSVPVTLTREVTEGEYTATLIMSESEGEIEWNKSVYFADGVNSATAWLYFNNMELGNTYGCVLTLSPQDVATGGAITSIRITVNYDNWINLGWGIYDSGLFGQTVEVPIQQVEGTNKYRMQQLYDTNYDIEFVINVNNDLYIVPQPCYYHNNYGVIWMMGYANQDDSGFAGMYDPNTKTAELQIRYYCDAGVFPIQLETLRMP